jgi:hypothetical protein
MTENSPLVGAPRGADNLRTASASFGGPSNLKNATGRYKLGLTEASIWRISVRLIVVPEPATWAMLLIGFGALGILGYRKTRSDNALA